MLKGIVKSFFFRKKKDFASVKYISQIFYFIFFLFIFGPTL